MKPIIYWYWKSVIKMQNSKGMTDVSIKDVRVRTTKANGPILFGEEAFQAIKQGTCIKGDVSATAKIAAIQALKLTPTIVLVCHPVVIEAVEVNSEPNESEKSVSATIAVKSSCKTGVEMEALYN